MHILVDTVGHSFGGRTEVLAMKPSAVQVEVMPLGSFGTDRVFVSDRVVTPPEYVPPRAPMPQQLLNSAVLQQLPDAVTYTESLLVLPPMVSASFSARHEHTNLHELPLRTDPQHRRLALRSQLGLPSDALLYAYGGRLHSITDLSLQAWVKVLELVPNSHLVLAEHPPEAKHKLTERAGAMGLADAALRLVWNSEMGLNDTALCLVLAAADLVLDTPTLSFGGAVAQAMLVSAPLLTVPHRSLVSRMAASQVLAAYPESGGPPLLEDHAPFLLARNVADFIDLATRVGSLKWSAEDGDDWLPFVPYHDIRERLLLHDGAWSPILDRQR
jgi:predicted O-linked N-acetylglucosamine transferase (SPINDLY family)